MVQKYKSPIRTYKYPFELVMAAYERRFPSCDMIPVLVSTDIIKEELSDDESLHIIERRCKLNVDAPYLLKKVAGVEYFYCIQRNTLDRRARTLQIEAWNESFAKKIVINEYCRYFVHPENEYWTCFEQTASLEVKSFFGFESAVEKLAVKLYAQSIEKGKEIIEMHVTQLKSEGITYMPRFGGQVDGDGDGEIATGDAPINGSIVARDGHASDNIVGNEDDTSNKIHQNSRQNSAKHKNSHSSSTSHKHKLNSSAINESTDSRSEKSSKFNSKSSSPSSSSVGQVIQSNNNSNHCMPSSSMVATSSSSLESTITTSSFSSSTITVANSSGAEDSSSLNNGLSEDFTVTTSTSLTRTEYYSS